VPLCGSTVRRIILGESGQRLAWSYQRRRDVAGPIPGKSPFSKRWYDWIDAVSEALGTENTDERGRRFAPHGASERRGSNGLA
jgi:hypothetical protein